MNNVVLIGRLTKDPEVRYTSGENSMAVANFNIAVSRQGKDDKADFPHCIAFGKTAEFIEKYFSKGKQIALTGRIQTGSYENKDGAKVYTTDVIVDRVEFVGSKNDSNGTEKSPATAKEEAHAGFDEIDDDLPF